MYKYRVSIIVPIFNAVNYIERCVQSLMNQTLSDIQFIFVDDKSNDGSLAKLEEVLQLFPDRMNDVIIYKHLQNSGVATVRNTGLSLAKGEYIGWVDADDWIEINMFEVLYTKAKDELADIVWCDYINVFDSGEQFVTQSFHEDPEICIKAMLNGSFFGGMWNKLVKKDLYDKNNVRFPDGLNMCEDIRVNVQLFYYANKISYKSGRYYYYYKQDSQTISFHAINNPTINFSWIENVKGIIRFLDNSNLNISRELINIFKLAPKKNLLIKGRTINAYKEWRSIFPESNYAVKYTNYPLHYKLLAKAADKEIWWLIKIWILMKYKLFGR